MFQYILRADDSKKYDAIVVAVGHNKFKAITQEQYDGLIKNEKIIVFMFYCFLLSEVALKPWG